MMNIEKQKKIAKSIIISGAVVCVVATGVLFANTKTVPGVECNTTQESVKIVVSTSESAKAYMRRMEGYTPYAVWDYAQYTYGYGSRADYEGQYISEYDAKELFDSSLALYENAVCEFEAQNNLHFNQNQFDALVSFSYNLGAGVFKKYADSDLVRLIVSGNYTDAEITDAFCQFCKAGGKVLPGLVARREWEAKRFLGTN